MSKEQKILLLFVILASGIGATVYVTQKKAVETSPADNSALPQTTTTTETTPKAVGTAPQQNTPVTTQPEGSVSQQPVSQVIAQPQKLSTSVTYPVPEEHTNTLSVTVVLSKGIITDVTFSENPTNGESREYYEKFTRSFNKSAVVGKTLKDVSLSRVGGASLTTKAFNDALSDLSNS
jgi:hypothetical protein